MTVSALFVLFLSAAQWGYGSEGKLLYAVHCSDCHGINGTGGNAPALNKKGFLITADLEYIERTIVYGRKPPGCPSFADRLNLEEIRNITRFIKGWQTGVMIEAPDHDVAVKDNKRGREIFPICGGCHGFSGEGAMGPSLLDPGFLQSASDTMLRRTIMFGRPGTPMKGFLKGVSGLGILTEESIDDLISYLRFLQENPEKTTE